MKRQLYRFWHGAKGGDCYPVVHRDSDLFLLVDASHSANRNRPAITSIMLILLIYGLVSIGFQLSSTAQTKPQSFTSSLAFAWRCCRCCPWRPVARGFERVAATIYGDIDDDEDELSDFGEVPWRSATGDRRSIGRMAWLDGLRTFYKIL